MYTLTLTVQQVKANADVQEQTNTLQAVCRVSACVPSIDGLGALIIGIPFAPADVNTYLPGTTLTFSIEKQ